MTSTTSVTKAAKVKRLLGRRQGASIDDMATETGWKPHSVRAFLTGMRKKGHNIVREQNGSGTTVYRLTNNAGPAKRADQ